MSASTRELPALLEKSGRFRVITHIGGGGMGVVYRVHDRERGEDVALKTLRPDAFATHAIKHEFRSLADIAHPNVVTLHELLCIEDTWCITMELVEGADFFSYVSVDGPRPVTAASATTQVVTPFDGDARDAFGEGPEVRLAADFHKLDGALGQLCAAVAALHAAGKLHLDLKPMNVLVQPDGRVVVLDFGLAQEVKGRRPAHGEVLGTPQYMAPEQPWVTRPTEACDWYAVGSMLYEALTGITPFVGAGPTLLAQKQFLDAPRADRVARDVPAAWADLCARLLCRDPSERAGLSAVEQTLGRTLGPSSTRHWNRARSDVGLVGRADLRALLSRACARTAAEGTANVVLLRGVSGIGKTTLARHFLSSQMHGPDAALLLSGRCLEREAVPYKALDSVVDSLSQYLSSLSPRERSLLEPDHVGALARVFPVLSMLASRDDLSVSSSQKPFEQVEREQAFSALKSLLLALSRRRRVIVFIDDLQWGDRDSALLVRELLSPPNAPPIFWLFAYRRDEEDSSPFLRALLHGEGGTNTGFERVDLSALSDEDSVQLVKRHLSVFGHDDTWAGVIAKESEGNPFFAEELTRSALEFSREQRADSGPPSLEQLLLSRVRHLPEVEQRLLEWACVVGRPLGKGFLLRLSGPEGGPGTIDALRNQRLLRTRGLRDVDLVEAYHDRVREIVAASVAPQRRMQMHLQLARELEADKRGDAELLMQHYAEAGEYGLAAGFAERAAMVAERALAFEQSVLLWRRAIELSARDDGLERARLHASLARALERAGHSADAAAAFLLASEHAPASEAHALRRKAGEQHLVAGQYARGISLFRSALPSVGLKLASSSKSALLSLAYLRARLAMRGLSFERRAEPSIDPKLLARIDTSYAVANSLGMLDSLVAAEVQTRGVLWALKAGEPFRVLRALVYESAFRCGDVGGQDRTAEIITQSQRLADELGTAAARGLVAFADAFFLHHGRGDLRFVRERYAEGERLLLDSPGMNGEVVMLRCSLLTALDWLFDTESLLRRIPMHLADAERRGDLFLETGIVSAAMYWLSRDAVDELDWHISHCRDLWPRDGFVMPHYWLLVAQAQRDVYAGEGLACIERVQASWADLKRSFYLSIPTVRIEILYPRARAALSCASAGVRKQEMLARARRDIDALKATRRDYAVALATSLVPNLLALEDAPMAPRIWALSRAIEACEGAGLVLQGLASRHALGRVLGGEAGELLRGQAMRGLRERGVAAPMRLIAAVMPAYAEG